MIIPRELVTPAQARILDAVEVAQASHGGKGQMAVYAAAAKALGTTADTVRTTIHRAKVRAARHGWAPEHGLTHPAPPGATFGGATTLYRLPADDPSGRVLAWVRTKPEVEAALESMRSAVDELASRVRPAAPLPAPVDAAEDLLVVAAFGDPHFGMHADARETGHAHYDKRIASKVHRKAMDVLAERTPAAGKCVLALIGDNMHADGRQWVTPKNRNVLDGDGRTWAVYDELYTSLAWMADRALLRHATVEVVIVPGNHDPILSHTMAVTLRAHYKDESRIKIADLRGSKFYFTTHGKCLLGFYHGDGKRAGIKDFGELAHGHPAWSSTRIRHGYTGHVHEERRLSGRGWTAESLPTLAPPDSHAAGEGYSPPHVDPCSRSAKADVYHVDGRRVSTHFVIAEECT